MDITDIQRRIRVINAAREAGATAHELAQVTLTLAVDLEEAAFIAWSNLLLVAGGISNDAVREDLLNARAAVLASCAAQSLGEALH